MAAIYVNNLIINAGSDFSQTFNLESDEAFFNLSGFNVSAQMRKWSGSSTAYDFNCFIADESLGRVVLSMTYETTSSIKPGRYVYDVVIQDPQGTKNRVIEGMVLVREGVTK